MVVGTPRVGRPDLPRLGGYRSYGGGAHRVAPGSRRRRCAPGTLRSARGRGGALSGGGPCGRRDARRGRSLVHRVADDRRSGASREWPGVARIRVKTVVFAVGARPNFVKVAPVIDA